MQMKKVFRYGYSTLYVLVGMIVSFFVFNYYHSAKQIDINEEADRENYHYNYELAVMISGDSFELDSLNYEELDDCNISIVDQMMYFDAAAGCYMTDIVLNGREFIYPIVKGHYPYEEELASNTGCAVIGIKMKKYTFRKNENDYIKICGDDYLVTGYISAVDSVVFDYRTILYYECLGEGVTRDLEYFRDMPGWILLLQSNTLEAKTMNKILNPNIDDGTYYMSVSDDYEHFTASGTVRKEYKSLSVIVYIFSVITIILVIEYWLICRQKEFAIRKAYGYSSVNLFFRLMGELVFYIVVSIVVSEAIMLILNLIEKEAVIFAVSDFSVRLIFAVRYMAITVPILLLRPAIKLFSDNPIRLLANKDN